MARCDPIRRGGVLFFRASAADLMSLKLQGVQQVSGTEMTPQLAEYLVAEEAWSAVGRDQRLLFCGGIYRSAPGWHGVAWAMLAAGIGAEHLAITRFVRERVAAHPARRVEAMVRLDVPSEPKWAALTGLSFVVEVPGWGPPDGALRACYARVREDG